MIYKTRFYRSCDFGPPIAFPNRYRDPAIAPDIQAMLHYRSNMRGARSVPLASQQSDARENTDPHAKAR
jgi:hypothetical protein